MRWFRSHIQAGSRLALFALAVQVILCFGHIDCADLGLTTPGAAAVVSADGAGTSPSGKSTQDQPNQSTDRGCPICALIQLASVSAPPAPPLLPAPATFAHVRPPAPDDILLAASPHFHFNARAPPCA